MRWLIAVSAALVLSSMAPGLSAQEDTDFSQIKEVARAKAEEGLELYGEQRWSEAYERFRIAEDLFHAPTLVLFMGHCQREMGNLLAARDLYQRVTAEQLAEDAPEAFVEAVATADEHLRSLKEAIPRLTLEVMGVGPGEARVRLDGRDVAVGEPVAVDPGAHRIVATAPEMQALEREIELAEGREETVTLELEKVAAPAPVLPPPPPTAPPPAEPGSLLPALIAGGIGVAGLAVGGIAGGLVLSKVSDIKASCDGNRCPEALRAEADDAQTLATISNVGFIVGGVGAVAAVTFVFWRPWGDDSAGTSPRDGVAVEAAFTGRDLFIRGRF